MSMWCFATGQIMIHPWSKLAELSIRLFEKVTFSTGVLVSGMLKILHKLTWFAKNTGWSSQLLNSLSTICSSETKFNLPTGIFLDPTSLAQQFGPLWLVEFWRESITMEFQKVADLIKILNWKFSWRNTWTKKTRRKLWRCWMISKQLLSN